MMIRAVAGLGLAAIVLSGTVVGNVQDGMSIASAKGRDGAGEARRAAGNAEKARTALAKGQTDKAVSFAEDAVAAAPHDAGYRALLGQTYLKAGRFASAEAAWGDALTLSPTDGRAALNLALAQIAGGHWDAAHQTLDAHGAQLDPADLGLAMALAGNPTLGVQVLVAATRQPTATAKTRQNLALALALGGQWLQAREMAGLDLPPAEADQRIAQWAAFARPNNAADQVAALLGVKPAQDPGQPVALALNASVPVAVAKVDALPAPQSKPLVSVEVPPAQPAPVMASKITFAAPKEVVQALPPRAPMIAAKPVTVARQEPVRRATPAAPSRAPQKGDWYIQIGAFASAGVAKQAWSGAQRRFAGFAGLAPAGMSFKTGNRDYYRLSVGGFARADADSTCRAYRVRGGTCFVRAGAGERTAQWAKTGVQVAAR